MSGHHPPVTDWATDFDHTDEAWAADPFPIWDELRATCPVAHSDRFGGMWLPTRHDDVSAIAYDTEHFTSRSVIVNEGRPLAPAPIGIAPPISSDPPFHHDARRLLLPAFSPKAIAPLEPFTRAYCHELLDGVEGVDLPQEQRIANFGRLDAYLTAQVQDHIDHPRDDLTSYLLQAEIDGRPLAPSHVGGTIALL